MAPQLQRSTSSFRKCANLATIDISKFERGNEAERLVAVGLMRKAAEESGFMLISGHQIPQKVFDDLRASASAFFLQTEDQKHALNEEHKKVYEYLGLKDLANFSTFNAMHGYSAVKGENVGKSFGTQPKAPNDPVEKLSVAPCAFHDAEATKAYTTILHDSEMKENVRLQLSHFFSPHVFSNGRTDPEGVKIAADLERSVRNYALELQRVANTILRILSSALGLPEDALLEKMVTHNCDVAATMRVLHYPQLSAEEYDHQAKNSCEDDKAAMRLPAHTDGGAFTLLWRPDDEQEALEIYRNGEWKAVPYSPDNSALVMNLGDLLSHWTGGVWKSTLHRVSAGFPTEEKNDGSKKSPPGVGRLAVPFFVVPDNDMLIQPMNLKRFENKDLNKLEDDGKRESLKVWKDISFIDFVAQKQARMNLSTK